MARTVGARRSTALSRLAGLADQGLSSGQNLLLLAVVARSTDAVSFGAFSVAMTTAVLLIQVGRALVAEPSLIILSGEDDEPKPFAQVALTLACGLSIAMSVVLAVAGLLLPVRFRPLFLVLAVAMPALLSQNACRFLLLAQKRTQATLAVDTAWVAAWAVLLIRFHHLSTAEHLAAWSTSSALGTILGLFLLRPSRDKAASQTRRRILRASKSLLVELLAAVASGQILIFALASIAGISAVGGLRAAQSVYGPVSTLMNAMMVVYMPVIAKQAPLSTRTAKRTATRLSIGCVALACMVLVGTRLIPTRLGTVAFGDTWAHAAPLLLPLGLQRVAGGAWLGAYIYLRATGKVPLSVRATIVGVVLETVLAVAAAPYSIFLAVNGMAAGTAVMAVLMWIPVVRPNRTARGRHARHRRQTVINTRPVGANPDPSSDSETTQIIQRRQRGHH